jgi:hypothetical protein
MEGGKDGGMGVTVSYLNGSPSSFGDSFWERKNMSSAKRNLCLNVCDIFEVQLLSFSCQAI